MNIVKNIFGRIWAFWGILTFATTFLLMWPFSMLSYFMAEIPGQIFLLRMGRLWMKSWLSLIGCPVKITGREHFKPGENYVIVFNHNSLLDPPLSAPFFPGANKTVAKASFAKVPIFGLYYKKGSILVDRKSDASRRKSFDEMKKFLMKGMHICIYPEGTRNRTQEPLKNFHDGAFKLATDTGKQILPCILTGTKKALPSEKAFYLMPHKLGIHVLPPVESNGLTVKDLKNKVFEIMKTEYVKREKI